MKSVQANGRTISATIEITLSAEGEPGSTEGVNEIGIGLIREVAGLLKRAAEAEGFHTQVLVAKLIAY